MNNCKHLYRLLLLIKNYKLKSIYFLLFFFKSFELFSLFLKISNIEMINLSYKKISKLYPKKENLWKHYLYNLNNFY